MNMNNYPPTLHLDTNYDKWIVLSLLFISYSMDFYDKQKLIFEKECDPDSILQFIGTLSFRQWTLRVFILKMTNSPLQCYNWEVRVLKLKLLFFFISREK